ncbi:MAG: molybdopterin molybdenumtransferase MoeA [Gammaproteobacteria bacterium]|nr:MAG: molybdopterin molybdenumtransferase MoeA [Gammaproteobacteria bacterium]
MIPYQDAQARLAAALTALPVTQVPVREALGLVAAADARSPGDVPPFTNSAMDGFAVRAADTLAATAASPCTLGVVGHTAAGPVAAQSAPPGPCAWEIMTGAPLPAGFDAVVPVERTERVAGEAGPAIRLEAAALPHQNVRFAGEDFRRDDPVITAGRRVGPEQVMALAATGVVSLEVRRRPRVAVITTGAELVSEPTQPLAPGQIRDSNAPYLEALLPALGADLVYACTLGDDPKRFAAALAEARTLSPDLLITSGAVSAGVHDFIPAALRDAGAVTQFHKAAIRPGKPILFAMLPDGTACFGLPGNPLSVAVGARFFVAPALRILSGEPPEAWPVARLAAAWKKPAHMTFFGKGAVQLDGHGQLVAEMLPGQESFRIAPLTRANAWIVLPEGPGEVEGGRLVQVAPLLPGHLALPNA